MVKNFGNTAALGELPWCAFNVMGSDDHNTDHAQIQEPSGTHRIVLNRPLVNAIIKVWHCTNRTYHLS